MAVRLKKADLGSQEEFGAPKDVIKDFISAGAKWIHLVDLDAAFGVGDNSALLKNLIKDSKVKVQISGGIIDEESLNVAIATTAARINLATSCLTDIEWVKKILLAYGERISISCLLYTSPSPRDGLLSRMPSSA